MNAVADPRADRLHELLADRATQGLSPDETGELESLGGSEDSSYDWAAASVDLPGLMGDLEPMPPSVRKRVDVTAVAWLAKSKGLTIAEGNDRRTDGDALFETPRAVTPRTTTAASSGAGAGWMPWLAAAAAIALAAVAWWPDLTSESTPLVSQRESLMALADTTNASWTDAAELGVTGDVVWNNDRNEGFLRFRGLPANDPKSMQYQLWIFDKDRATYSDDIAVDGGVFDVQASAGEVIVPIHAKLDVRTPSLFAVTTEPPGGVVKHTTNEEKGYRIILTAKPNA